MKNNIYTSLSKLSKATGKNGIEILVAKRFLTCPCHKIYSHKAVVLNSMSRYHLTYLNFNIIFDFLGQFTMKMHMGQYLTIEGAILIPFSVNFCTKIESLNLINSFAHVGQSCNSFFMDTSHGNTNSRIKIVLQKCYRFSVKYSHLFTTNIAFFDGQESPSVTQRSVTSRKCL